MLERLFHFFSVPSHQERLLLLIGSGGLAIACLFFFLQGVLPFGLVNFLFFSSLIFLASLFRPAWVFLVFLTLLPLEIVTVAPAEFDFLLRPYQWIGFLLALAVALRFLTKRTPFPPFRFTLLDTLLLLLPLGSFLSALVASSGESIRLACILTSYFLLYLLARIFIKNERDLFAAFPFFLVGAGVTLIFGLLQNIWFLGGGGSMAVMPGRPNGTLGEPDWLGMFILIVVAALLTWLARERAHFVTDEKASLFSWRFLGLFISLTFSLVMLILTVSRSAWLGGIALLILFLFLPLMTGLRFSPEKWRESLFFGNFLVVVLALSIFIVVDLHLTRFDLFNRAESTASGLQSITIACQDERSLPATIQSVDELALYNCRHIDLEAIPAEREAGLFITTIDRPDPNVSIRKNIYGVVGETLRTHPLLGIGWGSIGPILGVDERGASLNASNVYLEIWLGSGLIGLVAFLVWLALALFRAVIALLRGEHFSLALFFFLSLVGISIFNLFNSGILLGFVWVLFAFAPLLSPHDKNYAHDRH